MTTPAQRRPERAGDLIPVVKVWASSPATDLTGVEHLIGVMGLSGDGPQHSLHDNDASGATMWLCRMAPGENAFVVFDFGATYPLGEMWVWNYNQHHPVYGGMQSRGLKDVRVEYALDGQTWTVLTTGDGETQSGASTEYGEYTGANPPAEADFPFRLAQADGSDGLHATNLDDSGHSPIQFHNVLARFVKITAAEGPNRGNWGGYGGDEPVYGLSAVRFFAGRGLAAEPDEMWTDLFHQKSGWSGSDGINSIPMDGIESPGSAHTTRTLILFGDTFIGEVDAATDGRLQTTMINNSTAVLEGGDPSIENLRFMWNTSPDGEPASVLVPTTPNALAHDGTYYWLQDGTVVNEEFHCFPFIIGPYPEGPEGFQFQVHGITRVSAPIVDGEVAWDKQTQVDTPLFFRDRNGQTTYFGCAVFPNTQNAGAPNPDGFVYVYGLKPGAPTQMVAARVREEALKDFESWRYWDGQAWSEVIEAAAVIAPSVSSELSVSPMQGSFLDGKYVLVCQIEQDVCLYVGQTPIGPFNDPIHIYHCPESQHGNQIYVYNAKGHPHLSDKGELLASYNVNSTSWDAHMEHANIYRPRFIRIRQIQ